MRNLVVLILPAIFGVAYSYSSGEQNVDYNLLEGPPKGPTGQLVNQNHGAVGNPNKARQGIERGGNSGVAYDYNLYDGPAKTGQGPAVSMEHGTVGIVAPQTGGNFNGGDSNDDGGGGAINRINPQIIPGAGDDDSRDTDRGNFGAFGGAGGAIGGAANAGDDSNSVDRGAGGGGGAAVGAGAGAGAGAGGSPLAGGNAGNSNNAAGGVPNPAPVAGGADVGLTLQRNDLKASASGMSGGAVAGVVIGVGAVAAVGTAVAVVVLRSGTSAALVSSA